MMLLIIIDVISSSVVRMSHRNSTFSFRNLKTGLVCKKYFVWDVWILGIVKKNLPVISYGIMPHFSNRKDNVGGNYIYGQTLKTRHLWNAWTLLTRIVCTTIVLMALVEWSTLATKEENTRCHITVMIGKT